MDIKGRWRKRYTGLLVCSAIGIAVVISVSGIVSSQQPEQKEGDEKAIQGSAPGESSPQQEQKGDEKPIQGSVAGDEVTTRGAEPTDTRPSRGEKPAFQAQDLDADTRMPMSMAEKPAQLMAPQTDQTPKGVIKPHPKDVGPPDRAPKHK